MRATAAITVALSLMSQVCSAAELATKDFFRQPIWHDLEISPSGTQLAATFLVDGKYYLAIMNDIDQSDPKASLIYGMEGDSDVYQFSWIDDSRILFNSTSPEGSLAAPRQHEDLFLAFADRKELHPLYNSEYVHLIGLDPSDPDSVVVASAGEVRRLNVKSGNTRRIGDAHLDGAQYFIDHQSQPRVAVGMVRDTFVLRSQTSRFLDTWSDIETQPDDYQGLRTLDGLGFSADDSSFFYLSDQGSGGTNGVFAFDLASGKTRLIFRDPTSDISEAILGRDMVTPIGVRVGVPAPGSLLPAGVQRGQIADAAQRTLSRRNRYGRELFKGWLQGDRSSGQRSLARPLLSHRPEAI